MRYLFCLLALGLSLMCQSCCTSALWRDANPNERVWIDADKISEEELRARGVQYQVHVAEWGTGYLVEKSGWDRFKDYHLRALGAPVTLVADAASTVVVVGVYMFLTDPVGTCNLIEALCD